jgi:hypothetical protein
MPSLATLSFRSTWNKSGNCDPIPATVRLYRVLQLAVFIFCPFTRTSRRQSDAGSQGIMPSLATLYFRSTRNQCGNCSPILATVRLYRILQLTVFYWCPFTRTFIRSADAGIQGMMPSVATLYFRSTWNQRGNGKPIFATVHLYCIHQFAVFIFCPFTLASSRLADTGI